MFAISHGYLCRKSEETKVKLNVPEPKRIDGFTHLDAPRMLSSSNQLSILPYVTTVCNRVEPLNVLIDFLRPWCIDLDCHASSDSIAVGCGGREVDMSDGVHAFDEDGVLESAPVAGFWSMALGRASMLFENGRLELHPKPPLGYFILGTSFFLCLRCAGTTMQDDQNFACMNQTHCHISHSVWGTQFVCRTLIVQIHAWMQCAGRER